MLKEKRQAESSVFLNNLQNYILKLTSLLRSRLPDMSDNSLQEEISNIVETVEQLIGEIFDSARDMLELGNLEMTPIIESTLEKLSTYISKSLSLRASIEEAVSSCVDTTRTINIIIEQIQTIDELHQASESSTIREVLNHLNSLVPELKEICATYGNAPDDPKSWLDLCVKLIGKVSSVKEIVEGEMKKIEEESMKEVMIGYCGTVDHLLVQFKIGVAAAAYGIHVKGFESLSFIAPLKDFSFVTYPFMYNLQEVMSLEGQNVQ